MQLKQLHLQLSGLDEDADDCGYHVAIVVDDDCCVVDDAGDASGDSTDAVVVGNCLNHLSQTIDDGDAVVVVVGVPGFGGVGGAKIVCH